MWANSPWSHSYDSVWGTELSIRLGDASIAMDLRHWVNEGLMTFFFLVVGLEAKRELELGQLRERRRLAALSVMSVAAMASAVGIYLAFNAGGGGAHGWGAAMSTDTAFALGVLAAALIATVGGWAAFRVIRRLPPEVRARQISRTADDLVDLSDDVDPACSHHCSLAMTFAP